MIKRILNPEKVSTNAPIVGAKAAKIAIIIMNFPISAPLFFLLLNLEKSTWYENQNKAWLIPAKNASNIKGQLKSSKENKRRKKIIKGTILRSIVCFKPILYEILEEGIKNIKLKSVIKRKKKKMDENE